MTYNMRAIAKNIYDTKVALLKERESIKSSIDILNDYTGDSNTTENEKELFDTLCSLRLDLLTKYMDTLELQLKMLQEPNTVVVAVDESLVMYKETS